VPTVTEDKPWSCRCLGRREDSPEEKGEEDRVKENHEKEKSRKIIKLN
jgi:hypothetical protein